jgi:dipeptidase D
MDMVCEKNSETDHDFEKQGIDILVDGDYIKAHGTTLGADNGIAIAIFMAILDSDNIAHPNLEIVLTTEEETTMNGAKNLDTSILNGKTILSLDHIRENELLVSCAGIVKLHINMPINRTDIEGNFRSFSVKITGLLGGHSGNDIHIRANSNILMARFLSKVSKEMEMYINDMVGGLKANAIPRENETIIFIREEDEEKLVQLVRGYNEIFKDELKSYDPDSKLMIKNIIVDSNKALDLVSTDKLILFLNLVPNGMQTMSRRILDLPESSLNVGVVTFAENIVRFDITIRSSIKTLEEFIINKLEYLSKLFNADMDIEAISPLLEYKENSKLRNLCIDIHKRLYGKEPEIKSVHAIVEAGVFNSKIKDLDMLLISPNLYDIHSPNERLSISSTQRTWEYLLEILKESK